MKQYDSVPVELIRAARNGDSAAVEQICLDKKALVVSIARKHFLVGGDVDDLVQEGMIGLYKAILSYDEEKNDCFDAFASMCVRRQILDAIRVANRDKNKPLAEGVPLDVLEGTSDGRTPEDELIRKEELTAYELAKKSLKPFEDRVLSLYLAGDSYREIAMKTDVDAKKIDNTLQRIKQQIKNKMTE